MDHPSEKGSNLSFQRTQGRPTASTALWGHLLRKTGSSQVLSSSLASTPTLGKHAPAVAPIDKAGASTRILLHDTQAHLEKFTDRVTLLTTGLDSAKRELVMAQKLYQDDHEQVIDKISGLANRCQTELQKSIGSPAQSADVREVTKDLSHLSSRLEAFDKKIDTLSSLNQTQSQALQIIQQQQTQLLAALVPILPLLQNVPLQIENARDRVKDSILELRQEALARDSVSRAIASQHGYHSGSRRSRPRSSGPSGSCDSVSTPSGRKRRRLEATLDDTEKHPARETSSVDVPMHVHHPSLDGPTVDQPTVPLASSDIPLATIISQPSAKTLQQSLPRLRSQVARVSPAAMTHGLAARISRSVSSKSQASRAVSTTTVPRTPSRAARQLSHTHTIHRAAPSSTLPHIPAGDLNSLLHLGGNQLARTPTSSSGTRPFSSDAVDLENSFTSGGPVDTVHIKHENLVRLAHLSLTPRTLMTPIPGHRTPVPDTEGTSPMRALSVVAKGGAQVGGMPPPSSAGKPMSLKDRRAMFAEAQQRDEGKRFIPLNDEDDEDEDADSTL